MSKSTIEGRIKRVKSPCIGVCSTGIGDSVCRGCKRFTQEVIHWNAYSEAEKNAIQQRLHALLEQVVRAKVTIQNSALLESQLDYQKIRYVTEAGPYCWVFSVLKAGANQLNDLKAFGCDVNTEFAHLSLVELRDAIDEDYYTLSLAHFERYFDRAPI